MIPKGSRKLFNVRIQADDFRVQNCRESDPCSIRNKRISSGAIYFVSRTDVGHNRAFQGQDIGECQCWTMLSEEQLRPLGISGKLRNPEP